MAQILDQQTWTILQTLVICSSSVRLKPPSSYSIMCHSWTHTFMMLSSITDTEPMSKNDCVINAARYLHNMQILVPQHVNELRLLLLDPLSSTHCTYDTNYSFHTYHKVVPKLFHRRRGHGDHRTKNMACSWWNWASSLKSLNASRRSCKSFHCDSIKSTCHHQLL
jgi:hypothetical protein